MNKGLLALLALALVVAPPGVASAEEFSAANAARHVAALSEAIGPRKTGTQGERAARDYIADRMREAGLEVRRLAVPRVGTTMVGSENVVGMLKGRLPDTILIGSHHDSRSATVPGANDDASAVGVMLETARILAMPGSPRPAHTLLFVSFCAEEEGLLGARYYAQTQDLSSLRLMINMDPVGQREIFITPFPMAPPLWANRALARVMSEDRIAGVMHDPLYLLVTRSLAIPFGADHEPFLDKGIPAFSISDRFRMWTYHTAEDRTEWIDQSSLAAAGRSVLGLVRWFDESPPVAGPESGTYVVLPIPGHPVFVVTGAIYSLAGVLILLAALWWRTVWWKLSRRGASITRRDSALAVVRAGMPLAGAVLGALVSEMLSQAIIGYRFSWWSRQEMHLAQAAAFSVAGLACGLLAAAKRRAPDEPETPMVLSVGLWSAAAALSMLARRPDIAFYFLLPAAMTLAAALMMPAMAGLGTLLGSLPLLTLVTPASYADAVAFLDLSVPAWISGPALLVLALPLALGASRTIGLTPAPAWRRRAMAWVAAAGLAAGCALLFVNTVGSSYDRTHRRVIQVSETIDLASSREGGATVRLSSGEYLRQVTTNLPGTPLLDRRVTTHTATVELPGPLRDTPPPAMTVEAAGEADVRDLFVATSPPARVDRARITLRSTEPMRVLDDGVWLTKNEVTRRTAHEMDAPSETFRLAVSPGQAVEVEVRLEMAEDVLGVQLSAPWTVFRWSAIITWRGSVEF